MLKKLFKGHANLPMLMLDKILQFDPDFKTQIGLRGEVELQEEFNKALMKKLLHKFHVRDIFPRHWMVEELDEFETIN